MDERLRFVHDVHRPGWSIAEFVPLRRQPEDQLVLMVVTCDRDLPYRASTM
jgi:hypothetical protein